jgi:hypothetical protein
MVVEPTTIDFRLQRKAVKDILSNAPDGIGKDELKRLAETKGIRGDDFQKVLTSLLNSGRTYYDEKSGRFRNVRTE